MGRATRVRDLPYTQEDVTALSEWLNEADWLRERRLHAWQVAADLPIPDTSMEPWRRTNITRVNWAKMVDASLPGERSIEQIPAELYAPLIGDKQGGLVVFVDGVLVHSELAEEIAEQGVVFGDLSTVAKEHPDLVQEILQKEAGRPEDGKFGALHAALWTHGVVLYVPEGVHIEAPFHSVEYAAGSRSTGTHIVAVVEENASAVFLHESAAPADAPANFHLHATELSVGKNSNLRYISLQNWNDTLYNFGHQRGRVAAGATLDWVDSQMGTRLTKAFMNLDLDGDDSFGRISGIYFPDGKQHLDLDTEQSHHALRTESDLLYKGALQGNSRTVWQGMISVDEGAQQTDGFQANRNLILERTARADSIPGLQIKADDVACTHAATIGKLDEYELFYLMSRGIPREAATRMVVLGFFDPILERIGFDEVKERLVSSIEAKLQRL